MTQSTDHGALMDNVYRYQRLFYDVTRKYYLLGRDDLISSIGAEPGTTVLEVACGTGRNLAKIRRSYPEARLFGLDISEEMLKSARAKLGDDVGLKQADACNFDPEALFGLPKFDHIVLSYSLSMIPDWQGAIAEANRHLSANGTLHIVDFGPQTDMPKWFDKALRGWLNKFHVTPRDTLEETLNAQRQPNQTVTLKPMYNSYAIRATLSAA